MMKARRHSTLLYLRFVTLGLPLIKTRIGIEDMKMIKDKIYFGSELCETLNSSNCSAIYFPYSSNCSAM